MTKENNETRIIGVKPAHDSDDFPVAQDDKDLLKSTVHLMAYHLATTTWKKILCNGVGQLLIDLSNCLENPPTEDEAGKAATSEWSFDHDADASAHHAKYTDTEARATFSPLTLHPSLFVPYSDTYNFNRDTNILQNRTSLSLQYFGCPVNLPNGVTVTKVTMYGFRNDVLAQMDIKLRRTNLAGTVQDLASVVGDWSTGSSSKYDDSISFATIDNTSYSYMIILYLDPNDSVNDVYLYGVKIDFTG